MAWRSMTTWTASGTTTDGRVLSAAEGMRVSYTVERRVWEPGAAPGNMGTWTEVGTTSTPSYMEVGLTAGRFYQYRVQATAQGFYDSDVITGNQVSTNRPPVFNASVYTGSITEGDSFSTSVLDSDIVVSDPDTGATITVSLSYTPIDEEEFFLTALTLDRLSYRLEFIDNRTPLQGPLFPVGHANNPETITIPLTARDEFGSRGHASAVITIRSPGTRCQDIGPLEFADHSSMVMGSFDTACIDPGDEQNLTYVASNVPAQISVALSGDRNETYTVTPLEMVQVGASIFLGARRGHSYSFDVRATDPDTMNTDDFTVTVAMADGKRLDTPQNIHTVLTYQQ